MQWQSAQWLWLLAALAIPLLLHILRRRTGREITFAAAHWLRSRPPQNWRRLQLREKWLLLLRLLLLSLLVLLLARPLLESEAAAPGSVLLVDPRIARADVHGFLARAQEYSQAYWLQLPPVPLEENPSPAAEIWPALSAIAGEPRYRRAHILLQKHNNPAGHRQLLLSPEWQWHALEPGDEPPPALPRIGLLGEGPPWLPPLLQELENGDTPASLWRRLGGIAKTATLDWLIYDRGGELPQALLDFVQGGGLLITDARVIAPGEIVFQASPQGEALETAALGRGSWLRYNSDWHSPAFYRAADFAHNTWRQWYARDWVLQRRNREYWSIDAPPGTPVEQSAQSALRAAPDAPLFGGFLLLLMLERLLSLRGSVRGRLSRG